jgi:hypothetical protein
MINFFCMKKFTGELCRSHQIPDRSQYTVGENRIKMTNILIASALAFAKLKAVQSFTKSINCLFVQTSRFSKIQQSVKRTTTALRAADESPVNQTVLSD